MTRNSKNERCTQRDYSRLFAGSAEPLQWLAFTLTGDEELSDRILAAGLEQSLKDAEHVFREWMVSWARRLIIKTCIHAMRPWTSDLAQAAYPLLPVRLDAVSRDRLSGVLNLPSEALQQRLLELDVLSRFVFVLRALEGYSRRETSLLLNIDDRTCEWIYVKAAEQLDADVQSPRAPWMGGAQPATDYSLVQAGD